eukprot:s1690_g5.t1
MTYGSGRKKHGKGAKGMGKGSGKSLPNRQQNASWGSWQPKPSLMERKFESHHDKMLHQLALVAEKTPTPAPRPKAKAKARSRGKPPQSGQLTMEWRPFGALAGVVPVEQFHHRVEEIRGYQVSPSVASVCRGNGGIILAGGLAEIGRMLTSQGDDDSLLGRAVQQIFAEICSQRSRRYWLHVSYVEMTATRMWDLLASGREVKLDERQRAKEISRRAVRHGPEDIGECLNEGNQCRSRSNLQRELKAGSHSVFMLDMDMEFRSAGETKMQKSTLTLVDLHGLDSASMSEAIGREASRKDLCLLGRALRRLSGPLWALLRRPLESTIMELAARGSMDCRALLTKSLAHSGTDQI